MAGVEEQWFPVTSAFRATLRGQISVEPGDAVTRVGVPDSGAWASVLAKRDPASAPASAPVNGATGTSHAASAGAADGSEAAAGGSSSNSSSNSSSGSSGGGPAGSSGRGIHRSGAGSPSEPGASSSGLADDDPADTPSYRAGFVPLRCFDIPAWTAFREARSRARATSAGRSRGATLQGSDARAEEDSDSSDRSTDSFDDDDDDDVDGITIRSPFPSQRVQRTIQSVSQPVSRDRRGADMPESDASHDVDATSGPVSKQQPPRDRAASAEAAGAAAASEPSSRGPDHTSAKPSPTSTSTSAKRHPGRAESAPSARPRAAPGSADWKDSASDVDSDGGSATLPAPSVAGSGRCTALFRDDGAMMLVTPTHVVELSADGELISVRPADEVAAGYASDSDGSAGKTPADDGAAAHSDPADLAAESLTESLAWRANISEAFGGQRHGQRNRWK
ncbi:hypothetical protein FNF28_07167 [Cafeteria roenbergensis]|uniref:Uncharacterized protein n=1 Tax=Cafeteria roenbergensis TaxID=33653 RepID=A0A5A8CGB8_CAFRO|nr:hypothetical protein FNF28_07167 [Cafeteria roenbergensis]